jgi:molybdopterin-guanine dinucleotide biosynthesis protein A
MAPLITGLVLSGGRGSRMGGVDKGLQLCNQTPLAQIALERLMAQTGVAPLACAVNANRHLEQYQAWQVPVWPDTLLGLPGPLAGFLAGLENCTTPYLLTVPCDSPRFPLDLAARLMGTLEQEGADLAMPLAPEAEAIAQAGALGQPMAQPVFCLMKTTVLASLKSFVAAGEGKILKWARQQGVALVPFDLPRDDPFAFCNINTLADLEAFRPPAPLHP